MSIVHFTTHSKQARAKADELRNTQISAGKGALIVDEKQKGEPRYLLEKIVYGAALSQPVKADAVPWKPDSMIILVGKDAPKVLDDFEALSPGFKKRFGPVKKMNG